MDALAHDDLVLAETHGPADRAGLHARDEIVARQVDLLAAGERVEVLAEQVHVQARGGLEVDVALRRARRGARVHGAEIVVHGETLAADAHPAQSLGNLHGRGGLAAAGRAGQQHDRARAHILGDGAGRALDLFGIGRVARIHEFLGVSLDAAVDLLDLIAHRKNASSFALAAQMRSILAMYSVGYLGSMCRSSRPPEHTSFVEAPPPMARMLHSSSMMQML